MSITELAWAIRRHWILFLVVLTLPIVAALAWSVTTTPNYRAEARSLVSFKSLAGDDTTVFQGAQFAAQRTLSYVGLVDSPQVLSGALKSLGLESTPAQLARRTDASSPVGTTLLDVEVTDTDGKRAADLANEVATQLGQQIEVWESQGDRGSPVVVDLVVPAVAQGSPTWPRTNINLLLAGLLGMALAVGATVTVDRVKPAGAPHPSSPPK